MNFWKFNIIICLVISFFSCRPAGIKTDIEGSENDSVAQDSVLQSEFIKVYHRFPSPDEMFLILENSKIDFVQNITNNPANAADYLNSRSQTLNLGVYIADFAYISVYKRYNESTEYFESIYKLCDNLRISSAFDYSLMKRIENNLSNPDSLKTISDLAFNSLNNYLVLNQNEKSFALISIGGFVEALYLSFRLANSYSDNNIMVQYITDQKYVLDNVIAFASQFNEDEELKNSVLMLDPIAKIYSKITIVPEETKVTKTIDGKLIIKGGNKLEISKEQYQELENTTTDVRNQIIKK